MGPESSYPVPVTLVAKVTVIAFRVLVPKGVN
jgi:hypothetical protein